MGNCLGYVLLTLLGFLSLPLFLPPFPHSFMPSAGGSSRETPATRTSLQLMQCLCRSPWPQKPGCGLAREQSWIVVCHPELLASPDTLAPRAFGERFYPLEKCVHILTTRWQAWTAAIFNLIHLLPHWIIKANAFLPRMVI